MENVKTIESQLSSNETKALLEAKNQCVVGFFSKVNMETTLLSLSYGVVNVIQLFYI